MFLREFVLGNNQTGLVTNTSGSVSVLGGENATLALSILAGQLGIYQGSGTTQSTYTFPSATIAAWNRFFANVTAVSTSTASVQPNGATGTLLPWAKVLAAVAMILVAL